MSPLGSRSNPEDIGHGIADAHARVVIEAAHLGLDVDPIGDGVADAAPPDPAVPTFAVVASSILPRLATTIAHAAALMAEIPFSGSIPE